MTRSDRAFVLCIGSGTFPASLTPRRVYETVQDAEAEARGLLRIVDDSGEDYLYPADLFARVQLSGDALRAFA